MDFTTTIYLADTIPLIAGVFGLMAGIAILLSLFGLANGFDEGKPKQVKFFAKATGVAFTVMILALLVPSKEAMYRIAAAQGVASVINQPDVRKLAGNSLELLNTELENYISEAKAGK